MIGCVKFASFAISENLRSISIYGKTKSAVVGVYNVTRNADLIFEFSVRLGTALDCR